MKAVSCNTWPDLTANSNSYSIFHRRHSRSVYVKHTAGPLKETLKTIPKTTFRRFLLIFCSILCDTINAEFIHLRKSVLVRYPPRPFSRRLA